MTRELIINNTARGVELALLEDKKLVELHQEGINQAFSVGDIVLARLVKTMPGLNAAFVDIGHPKNGFLHYSDLGPNIRSMLKYQKMAFDGITTGDLSSFKMEAQTHKSGKLTNVLTKKQALYVQITKEPISTKGHRLSCELTLPGRYVVMIPFDKGINISKKITNQDERKRLIKIIEEIKPQNFGVIVRTVAEGKTVVELQGEIELLIKKWKEMATASRAAEPPKVVMSEMNKTSTLLRDILNASFHRVVTNDKDTFNEIKEYISKISPGKESIAQYYSGKTPIYDHFDITKQIKIAFGKKVNMDSGAYLVIEHTEAMHVIDVNSGHKMSTEESQEESAMKINLEAAAEVARQLRLRDIGGIIVVDFIDMRNPANKQLVSKAMHDFMKLDKARHTILPLSRFNLLQITRERVKPQVNIETQEVCPTCSGTGTIGPSILLMDEIEKDIKHIVSHGNKKKLTLMVHPYLESHITKGFFSSIKKTWRKKHKTKLEVDSNESMGLSEYKFFDANGEEISVE